MEYPPASSSSSESDNSRPRGFPYPNYTSDDELNK